jgi:spermidine synthase
MKRSAKDTWRRICSYFDDVKVVTTESDHSGLLEVVWTNGRKVLNCDHANYSYGSLYKVFQHTFKALHLQKEQFSNVLILGYGAGGTAQILREEYQFSGTIHGVEVDEAVIRLSEEYFPEGYAAADRIFHADALDFVRALQKPVYDLVIFDVYIDLFIPEPFQQEQFVRQLNEILLPGGLMIYNKVMAGKPDERRARSLQEALGEWFATTEVITKNLKENRMFVARKSKRIS